MNVAPLLVELYSRIPPLARQAVEGLSVDQLTQAPDEGANPIGWLVWHTARVHDHHIGELMGVEQLWVADGWAARFGMSPDAQNHGYGHSPADVASVRPASDGVLTGYMDAVSGRVLPWLESLTAKDLDRVVDRRWDPPVTMGVRLVSVADDGLQHVGQAAYVRGLLGY